MLKLDSVNQVLAYVGEEPISDLTTPDYVVRLINAQYDIVKQSVLLLGHGFNSNIQTLAVDGNNEVPVPTGVLGLRFRAEKDYLTVKNGKVFNGRDNVYHNQAEEVLAYQDITFERIPEEFAHWITWEVASRFRVRLNGVDQTTLWLQGEARKAKQIALNSESSKASDVNGWGVIVAAHNA